MFWATKHYYNILWLLHPQANEKYFPITINVIVPFITENQVQIASKVKEKKGKKISINFVAFCVIFPSESDIIANV